MSAASLHHIRGDRIAEPVAVWALCGVYQRPIAQRTLPAFPRRVESAGPARREECARDCASSQRKIARLARAREKSDNAPCRATNPILRCKYAVRA